MVVTGGGSFAKAGEPPFFYFMEGGQGWRWRTVAMRILRERDCRGGGGAVKMAGMDETPVFYYDRDTQRVERELIYGEKWLRWAYATPAGRACLWAIIKRPFFSKWYGWRMSQPRSAARIAPFIKTYGLDVAEFLKPVGQFASFNDFFSRELKPAARAPHGGDDVAVFGADGRHSVLVDAGAQTPFLVKGRPFNLQKLFGSDELAARYAGGTVVFSRLCPVDYHRFHFPCDGTPARPVLEKGPLFSVNPIALRRNLGYLWENRRVRTEFKTERFGTVQLFEIGATNVGSITQTFTPNRPVRKGDEKGYFAFGGSALITVFARGAFRPADDLRAQTRRGLELYARCGTPMGAAAAS